MRRRFVHGSGRMRFFHASGRIRFFHTSRRIRSFHDLPLWIKALLAPMACLAAAVAVVGSIWLGTTETEIRLAAVADEALPTAAASAVLLGRVDTVHVMAMRVLVWQQAGVSQATIDTLIVEIGHGLDALRVSTAGMAGGRAEGDLDLPRLKQIAARSVSYAKLLGDALDLVADPPIAVGYFRRADTAFTALRDDIAELSTTGRATEAASIQSARGSSHAALVRSYWILGISGGFMLVLLPVVVAAISRPVRSLTKTMTSLVDGDMTAEVAGQDHRDELGDMARAVLVFKEHMVKGVQLADEKEAAGRRAEAEKRAALLGMAERIETETGAALREIERRTSAMAESADAMSGSAIRTGASARNATDTADQALANARSVANAAERLAGAIQEISGQVSESTSVAGRAVLAGGETRATIEALNRDVERISAVAAMIGEIASRTNLLALNATIEAARAGDAGRGFAVVASEVKALANQTARSTDEIADRIAQVRAATGASVKAVLRIEQTITEISAITGTIATAVRLQGAATEEIAHNVSETANATKEMTSRTTAVAAEAVETGRQAEQVRENATGLHASVEGLRHSVIAVVRTATSDMDRRLNARFEADLACRLTVAGQTHLAALTDWSDSGAHVRGGPPIKDGVRGVIDIDRVGFPLPFVVKRDGSAGLYVVFDLDPATAVRFGGIPARIAAHAAA